jgi:hypothetical protein
MKRRKFIQKTAIGGVLILGAPSYFVTGKKNAQSLISKILKRELSFLQLEESGVSQYALEYYTKVTSNKSSVQILKYNAKLMYLYVNKYDASKSWTVNLIAKNYLLGSDFFLNNMDESRTIHYMALFDPIIAPCNNPFSFLNCPA